MSQLAVISNLSGIGVVKDLPYFDLPVNAFTEATEMQFQGPFIKRGASYSQKASIVTGTPNFIVPDASVYTTTTKAYIYTGSSPVDITRVAGNYTMTGANRWNSDWLSSFLILNNGKDAPQKIEYNSTFGATPLADLPAWPAGCYAQVVRSFRNFLVAYNVYKGGVRYPTMVKWSNSAAPYSLPDSWDETDATKDAGETILQDTSDPIIDALPLNGSGGEVNLIYTQNATWGMRLSGNSFIFYFAKVFDDIGILAQDCVKSFRRRHFLVTKDDVVVHDGFQAESISTDRVREALNDENYLGSFDKYTFVVPFYSQQEMWVCFTENGAYVTKAYIWNWRLNTWTTRVFPNYVVAIGSAKNSGAAGRVRDGIFFADLTHIFAYAQKAQGTTTSSAKIERRSCALAVNEQGQAVADPFSMKDYLSFHPQITGTPGKVLKVAFAVQTERSDAINYSTEQTWTVGTTKLLPIGLSGRYLSYYIRDNANVDPWQLESLGIELTMLGRF